MSKTIKQNSSTNAVNMNMNTQAQTKQKNMNVGESI